jgi:hypothetical protein
VLTVLDVLESIVAGVVTAAILAATGLAWRNRRKPRAGLEASRTRWRVRRRDDRLVHLRSAVLHRAEELGYKIPVTATGFSPCVVTWSDETTTRHWPDFDSYRRAMTGGRTPPATSFPTVAPRALGSWSVADLRQWLVDHPRPT